MVAAMRRRGVSGAPKMFRDLWNMFGSLYSGCEDEWIAAEVLASLAALRGRARRADDRLRSGAVSARAIATRADAAAELLDALRPTRPHASEPPR